MCTVGLKQVSICSLTAVFFSTSHILLHSIRVEPVWISPNDVRCFRTRRLVLFGNLVTDKPIVLVQERNPSVVDAVTITIDVESFRLALVDLETTCHHQG